MTDHVNIKKRGFSFVGTVICYAHMQAIGMVDDHLAGCFRCRNAGNIYVGRPR